MRHGWRFKYDGMARDAGTATRYLIDAQLTNMLVAMQEPDTRKEEFQRHVRAEGAAVNMAHSALLGVLQTLSARKSHIDNILLSMDIGNMTEAAKNAETEGRPGERKD